MSPPLAPTDRRVSSHKRLKATKAFLLSVLAHAVMVAAIFGTLSGTTPSGASDPFGEGEALEVSMEGWEGASAQSAAGSDTDALQPADDFEALAQRLRNVPSDNFAPQESARPRGDLAALFDAIGQVGAAGKQGSGTDRAGDARRPAEDARTAQASRTGQGGQDASAGALWGQVEPCWRKIRSRSSTPVTLEITLSAEGRLAGPPRIVRAASERPDEQRLIAEAQALSAIQACLPYRTGAALGQTQRVSFNTPKPRG